MVKLTQFTNSGGCAAKVPPGSLSQVLRQLQAPSDPRLLVGTDTSDDAGVFLLNEETALIQTVDFFPPMVDDPYLFGQIAAANSLSDVYAMGGKPLTALNVVAWPLCKLPAEVLLQVLQGGMDKVAEAGAVLAGGHTIADNEPKYGLSVTGVCHPSRVRTNAGARPGDALVLTKALGTGILTTASRLEMFGEGVAAAGKSMSTLNKAAAQVMEGFDVHGCTDITGFGLLGHTAEVAAGSGVKICLDAKALPLLPEVLDAAAMGLIPAGAYTNRDYLGARVRFGEAVPEALRDVCYDPQTSGGLLIALREDEAPKLLQELQAAGVAAAAIIGRVTDGEGGTIDVE